MEVTQPPAGSAAATVADVLAQWTVTASWEDFPAAVQAEAGKLVVNSVGTGVGGSRLPDARLAVRAAGEAGQSPIFLSGKTASFASAVFANAVMFSCLGQEETHLEDGRPPGGGDPAAAAYLRRGAPVHGPPAAGGIAGRQRSRHPGEQPGFPARRASRGGRDRRDLRRDRGGRRGEQADETGHGGHCAGAAHRGQLRRRHVGVLRGRVERGSTSLSAAQLSSATGAQSWPRSAQRELPARSRAAPGSTGYSGASTPPSCPTAMLPVRSSRASAAGE